MIDPTGRSAQPPKQKLVRLITLLVGVFVVGCGIGWLFGQIEAPSSDAGAQRVATTLVSPSTPAPPAVAPDTLAQAQPTAAPAVNTAPETTTQTAPTIPVPPIVVEPSPAASSPQTVEAPPTVQTATVTPTVEPASVPVPAPVAPHRLGHKHDVKHRSVDRHHQHSSRHPYSGAVTIIGGKAAPAGARWVVQLGAFRTHDHAALLLMTLQAHGTRATIIKTDRGAQGIWYVVQTPAVPSLNRARVEARALAARENLSVSVLRGR